MRYGNKSDVQCLERGTGLGRIRTWKIHKQKRRLSNSMTWSRSMRWENYGSRGRRRHTRHYGREFSTIAGSKREDPF